MRRNSRSKYLFIRVQEACNADCFFCEFAKSQDSYRMSVSAMHDVARQAADLDIGVIRFTGGEPLMHAQIVQLVAECASFGHDVSIITNGTQLKRYGADLVQAGLSQVILSLDSPDPETHNVYRRTPHLFERAVSGIEGLAGLVQVRVNTVVGPHNYGDMPRMQRLLEGLGVDQWELSPIKLARASTYADRADVIERCGPIYDRGRQGALIPMGEPFYGSTVEAQDLYFNEGIVPRADQPVCRVTDDVRFLDPKNRKQYACSLLPHRDPRDVGWGDASGPTDEAILLDTPTFRAHQDFYRANGPSICEGCSTTAAGYSNDMNTNGTVAAWSY